jgi:tRNA modification GTPase
MTNHLNDTICALSTPSGKGAIALIRISGDESINIVNSIFSKKLTDKESHTVHFGKIHSNDTKIIDEVLISLLKKGKSFTGETTIEIACHGSNYIQQEILSLLVSKGCRMAEPGEFTKRAFLNGKLDLSQAEAVADLIASESKKAHELAINQMRGTFSNELKTLREKLIDFASLVELELDFSEEDVEFADRTQLKNLVSEVTSYVQRLISSFELGNAIKNGVPVAIVGAPNTGKSTLLNQLLGEERAIVSNIAGTTRDSIEETLNIDGIIFRLIDTAGIRSGLKDSDSDKIEAIGIERSLEKIKSAKIILVLTDEYPSLNQNSAYLSFVENIKNNYNDKKIAIVLNKIDVNSVQKFENEINQTTLLPISAKYGTGIENLKKFLVSQFLNDELSEQSTIVSNIRHLEALQNALSSLQQAKNGLESNVTGDFIAMDIRQAMFHIGSITGDISNEDLLGNIFGRFCIGK